MPHLLGRLLEREELVGAEVALVVALPGPAGSARTRPGSRARSSGAGYPARWTTEYSATRASRSRASHSAAGTSGGSARRPPSSGRARARKRRSRSWAARLGDGQHPAPISHRRAYGGGRSERAIGRWLAPAPAPTFGSGSFSPRRSSTPSRAIRATAAWPPTASGRSEGSLERLGVDHVDLYVIHEADRNTPVGDTLEALDGPSSAPARSGAVGTMQHGRCPARRGPAGERGAAPYASTGCRTPSASWSERARTACSTSARDIVSATPFSPPAGGGWLDRQVPAGHGLSGGVAHDPAPGAVPRSRGGEDLRRARRPGSGCDGARRRHDHALARLGPLPAGRDRGDPRPRRPAHLEPGLRALDLELTDAEREELGALFA